MPITSHISWVHFYNGKWGDNKRLIVSFVCVYSTLKAINQFDFSVRIHYNFGDLSKLIKTNNLVSKKEINFFFKCSPYHFLSIKVSPLSQVSISWSCHVPTCVETWLVCIWGEHFFLMFVCIITSKCIYLFTIFLFLHHFLFSCRRFFPFIPVVFFSFSRLFFLSFLILFLFHFFSLQKQ